MVKVSELHMLDAQGLRSKELRPPGLHSSTTGEPIDMLSDLESEECMPPGLESILTSNMGIIPSISQSADPE